MLSFLSLDFTVLFLSVYIIIFTFLCLFFIKNLYVRSFSLIFGVSGIGYILFTAINILGNPRPIELDFFSKEKYYIISSITEKNTAIYLWAIVPESKKPIYFSLPWSKDLSDSLVKAKIEARNNGGNIIFTKHNNNQNLNNNHNNVELEFKVESPLMPQKRDE